MTRALLALIIFASLGSYASAAPLYLNAGQSVSVDQNILYQYGGRVDVYCEGNYPPPPPPPLYWQCTYSCGSKSFQEPKVGRGRDQREASWNAQRQICTQYTGGHPQYFQGCERVQ